MASLQLILLGLTVVVVAVFLYVALVSYGLIPAWMVAGGVAVGGLMMVVGTIAG